MIPKPGETHQQTAVWSTRLYGCSVLWGYRITTDCENYHCYQTAVLLLLLLMSSKLDMLDSLTLPVRFCDT